MTIDKPQRAAVIRRNIRTVRAIALMSVDGVEPRAPVTSFRHPDRTEPDVTTTSSR